MDSELIVRIERLPDFNNTKAAQETARSSGPITQANKKGSLKTGICSFSGCLCQLMNHQRQINCSPQCSFCRRVL